MNELRYLLEMVIETTELEVKVMLIASLRLEGLAPGDIDSDAPLFGDGLGLDSIDALEIGVALHHRYGIVLPGDTHAIRRHFASVRALARLIDGRR